MSLPRVSAVKCRHCARPIVWLNTEAGHCRPFDAQDLPFEELPASDAWGLLVRYGRPVVRLLSRPPRHGRALRRHYCSQYAEYRITAYRITRAGLLWDTVDVVGAVPEPSA